ncbi:hypothetical protein N9L68_06340, partial [bacterium]|nr:hypothetical protein [bacterium]
RSHLHDSERGAGKVGHMEVRCLQLQQMIRDGRLHKLVKKPTEELEADLGTQVHTSARLEEVLERNFMSNQRSPISNVT